MSTTRAAGPKRKRAPVAPATAKVERAKKARVVKAVVRVDKDGTVLGEYASAAAAARELGVNIGSVSKVLSGERNHVGGYLLRYKDEDAKMTEVRAEQAASLSKHLLRATANAAKEKASEAAEAALAAVLRKRDARRKLAAEGGFSLVVATWQHFWDPETDAAREPRPTLAQEIAAQRKEKKAKAKAKAVAAAAAAAQRKKEKQRKNK